MMAGKSPKLIRASDIAELADVSPAAVSNWRSPSRGLGFPEPAGGSEARPLFEYDEVVAWLVENGRAVKELAPEQHLYSLMDEARGALDPEQFVSAMLPLLCLRMAAQESPKVAQAWKGAVESDPAEIRRRVSAVVDIAGRGREGRDLFEVPREIQLDDRWASRLLRSIDELPSAQLSRVGDQVLLRATRSLARGGGERGFVNSPLSRLLASLVVSVARRGTRQRPTSVYDPACGIAEVLRLTAQQVGPLELHGADISSIALTMARQRFYLAGLSGLASFSLANVIESDPNPALKADVVVIEPPLGVRGVELSIQLSDPRWRFGTPKGAASELAWLQEAIAHLSDEGRGIVVSAGNSLFAGGAVREVRHELLRQGCVEAIIELPDKLLAHTAVQLFIWVVKAPPTEPGRHVVLVDASSAQDTLFSDAELPDYIGAVNDFAGGSVPHALVLVTALLKEDSSLVPHEWTQAQSSSSAEDAAEEYWASANRLSDALKTLDRLNLPPDAGDLDFSGVRVLTVKNMVRDGFAVLTKGAVASGKGRALPSDVVRPEHVRHGLPPGAEVPEDDAGVTAKGDVLFTTMFDVHARVDHDGGRRVSRQVSLLRLLDESGCDPEFVAHCLMAPWNRRFQMGSAITRAKPDALEIPIPPLAVQRRIVETLAAVAVAKDVADAADAYATALLSAPRYGADLSIDLPNDEYHEGTIE
jgi:SAM-dependent methyltransferase